LAASFDANLFAGNGRNANFFLEKHGFNNLVFD